MRRFVLELLPDLVEFGLDHRRRHFKIMPLSELVEQLALHVGAREAVELLLDLTLQQAGELLEAFEAQRRREFVVDLGFARGLHRSDLQIERRGLAGEFLGLIIFRESDVDLALFAGLHANNLILETGDQTARAELDRHVAAGAAIERDIADLADEIHHDQIADLRLVRRLGIVPALLLVGELLELLVDGGIIGRNAQAFQLQTVDRRGRNVGEHFQLDLHVGVLAEFIAIIKADRGLQRGAQLLLGDQALNALLDRGVECVLHQRLAVHLAHEVGGHLARAEARHLDRRRNPLQFGINARIDILRADFQGVGALQAFVQRFDSLHFRSHALFGNI